METIFNKDIVDSCKADNEKYFLWKIQKGWFQKNIPTTKEYLDRVNYEVGIIQKMGFVDYMLIIADILDFANKNEVPRSAGRGCFTPNNRVKVNGDMFKNINFVTPKEDIVQCEDGQWRPVEQVFEYDCDEDLLTIQTENDRKIDGVTMDHKIKVVTSEKYNKGDFTPEWVEAKDIKEGDYILEQE